MAELFVLEPEAPGAGVVEMLEDLLGRARAGEFSSMAIAYVRRNGTSGRTWSNAPSFVALLGAIARLEHAFQLEKDDDNAAAG